MSIELHCPQCQKLIKAPDGAGGKRGKCPFCQAAMYIPEPSDELDVIPIKPIAKEDADREAELRRESSNFAASIDKVTGGAASADPREGGLGAEVDVASDVDVYVHSMHKSDLDTMHSAVARLKRSGDTGRSFVEELLKNEATIDFGDVPAPLAKGFLRKLQVKLT